MTELEQQRMHVLKKRSERRIADAVTARIREQLNDVTAVEVDEEKTQYIKDVFRSPKKKSPNKEGRSPARRRRLLVADEDEGELQQPRAAAEQAEEPVRPDPSPNELVDYGAVGANTAEVESVLNACDRLLPYNLQVYNEN